MKNLVSSLAIVGAIAFGGFAAIAQTSQTLGQQGAQWSQDVAKAVAPFRFEATPDYFVVNGRALYYSDAANMTPEQVGAFAKATL